MTLFDRVFGGNDAVYGLTEGAIDGAIAQYGEDKAVSFPNTAYSLPCYYAVTGTKVTTLKELKEALGVVKTLMTREKRLNDAFMSGVATALCAEFIEVLKYIDGATPYEEPCYGHLADAVIRELGVPLVTGDIPGVAVILGKAPSAQEAADLVKSYQSQGILTTLVGDVIDQLEEVGYKTGANVRVIPLGKDVTAVIHVVSVALRAALIFGNVKPGDAATLMDYTMKRVPAFVNAFAPLNDVIVACGAGAIALGFPVITNQEDVARVPKSLICQKDISKWNATSLEARDIKIKITNIDIPVAFASAFEGEIIRRKDMQVEFDGSRVDCAELVHIPQLKQKATVGYSVEAIVKVLDGVTNSQVDETGTTKPLLECITSGVIRGAVAMVGCNNPKIRPDYAHIELMKKCIANDIVVIASGCSAQAAAKAGLMDKSAKDLCGAGLKRVCELADIPPVLHMGSCVDISRMMILAAELAKDAGLQINQLPVVGCAPEWMSEKAVSIGNYVVGTGIDTFLGVDPYVSGSSEMGELLTEGTRKWTGAAYTVETDIEKLVDLMIERIEEKRTALGI